MNRLTALLLFGTPALFGAITSVSVETTTTQAKIRFVEPTNPSACTIAVSESSSLSPLVNDVDTSQFANANLASARATIIGNTVTWIIGTRATQTNLSGAKVSRALQAATTYYWQPSCGSDTLSVQSFNTETLPYGNTWSDPIPSDGSGNPNWPQFSLTDRTQKLIDPFTGVAIKRVTLLPDVSNLVTTGFQAAIGSAWTAPNNVNAAGNGTNWATINGSAAKLGALTPVNTYPWGGGNGVNPFGAPNTWFLTKLQFQFWAKTTNVACTGSTADDCKLQMCVSVDGVTCAARARVIEQAITTTSTQYTEGSWAVGDVLQNSGAALWNGNELSFFQGQSTCDGTSTITSAGPYMDFWSNGTPVFLPDGFHTINHVVNSQKLVLNDNCAAVTNGQTYINNFGMLVWKKTTSADTVSLNGAAFASLFGLTLLNPDFSEGDYASFNQVSTPNGSRTLLQLPGPGGMALDESTLTANPYEQSITDFSGKGNETLGVSPADTYWTSTDSGVGGGTQIWKTTYTGDYAFPQYINQGSGLYNPALPLWDTNSFAGGGNMIYLCSWTWPNLQTPPGQCITNTRITQTGAGIDQLAKAYNSTLDLTEFPAANFDLISVEYGYLVFRVYAYSAQQSLNWVIIFDPNASSNSHGTAGCVTGGGGCVIAMRNSWSSPGCRWCVAKEPGPTQKRGWSILTMYFTGDYGTPTHDIGPFVSTMVGSATTGVACPANAYGFTGNICITATQNGEPYDQPDGSGTAGKYGSAAVGDYAHFYTGTSTGKMTLIAKSGNNLTFAPQTGQTVSGISTNSPIIWDCNSADSSNYSNMDGGSFWNFLADPDATNTTGNTVVSAVSSTISHSGWMNSGATYAYTQDARCPGSLFPQACYQSLDAEGQDFATYLKGYNVSGLSPNSLRFAGMLGANNGGIGLNSEQSHPNRGSLNGYTRKKTYDARPFQGWAIPSSSTPATLVTGNLYKIAAANSTLNPKIYPQFASSGEHPLLNISGPGSLIDGTTAHSYQYCIALLANECSAGSSAGDVYVNAPYLTYPYCNYISQAFQDFSDNDICLMDESADMDNILEIDLDSFDPGSGETMRVLGHAFAHPRPSAFWHTHAACMQTGNCIWTNINLADNQGDLMALVAVPYPKRDSKNRTSFTPVSVSAHAPSGQTAAIEFYYAEYSGCTPSRAEHCFASSTSSTVNLTTPFYWGSESFTPATCASGCTITVPGISNHMMLAREVHYSGSTVIWQGNWQVYPIH